MHPFAPDDADRGLPHDDRPARSDAGGITGYDAVSLQPNAGSQGEFAGLLAIRAYHRSRGDDQRTVCLIPSSAHGTNAASAVMAGMEVVVVRMRRGRQRRPRRPASQGRQRRRSRWPPSWSPTRRRTVCSRSASASCARSSTTTAGRCTSMVPTSTRWSALAQPGKFGADVSHLNLHKTFCIPHGGGGPGVGPGRRCAATSRRSCPRIRSTRAGSAGVGAVAAAPFGSAGILSISWVYIALMGAIGPARCHCDGDPQRQLHRRPAAPAASRSCTPASTGRVAHECIVDLRPITKATGVTVDDVAKRLIDYGFHAPTMSFPVAGTLMIEPTESETLHELERFCDAMIAIRGEIDRSRRRRLASRDQPAAPCPAHRRGSASANGRARTIASSAPTPSPRCAPTKYFPPVSRIDAAYGDRNLVCSCEPLESLRRHPRLRHGYGDRPWLTARHPPPVSAICSVCSGGQSARRRSPSRSLSSSAGYPVPRLGRDVQRDDGADERRSPSASTACSTRSSRRSRRSMPQITRTLRLPTRWSNSCQRPIEQGRPRLVRLADTLSSPQLTALPKDLGEFMNVLADVARRLQPLGQLAEIGRGLFGLRPFASLLGQRPPPAPPAPPPAIAAAKPASPRSSPGEEDARQEGARQEDRRRRTPPSGPAQESRQQVRTHDPDVRAI